MHIALFINGYLPEIGGVEIGARYLNAEYLKRGHRVTVFTSQSRRELPEEEQIDGVQVYRFRWGPRPWYSLPHRFCATMHKAGAKLSVSRPDIVVAYFCSTNAVYAAILAERRQIPLVVSLLGSDVWKALDGRPLDKLKHGLLLPNICRRAAAVHAVSNSLASQATRLCPILQGRTTVIHNGIDLRRFNFDPLPLDERSNIVFIGRLTPVKGPDLLLDAFCRIHTRFPEQKLVFVGDGPQREQLVQKVEAKGLHDAVVFRGAVAPESISGVMRRARLLVVPSRHEACSNVLLEGMATGTPIVATSTDGTPELIADHKTGLLASPTTAAIAECITTVLSSDDLAEKFGRQARERVGKWSYDIITPQWIRFLDKVVAGWGHRNGYQTQIHSEDGFEG